MKKILLLLVLLCPFGGFIRVCVGQTITHKWKDTANSTDWNDGNNWDVGTAPNSSSNVEIRPSNYVPTLSDSITINHIDIGGSINIGSYKLTASQSLVSSFGFIQSNGGKIVSPNAGAFNFTTVQGDISLLFGTGILNGSNVFENALTLQVNSTSSFLIAHTIADHYKGPTTFINNGSGGIYLAAHGGTNPTIFEQSFSFINNAASANFFAENGNNARILFKGAVTIEDRTSDPNSFIRVWKGTFEQGVRLSTSGGSVELRGGVSVAGQVQLNATGGVLFFGGDALDNSQTIILPTGGMAIGSSGVSGGQLIFDRFVNQSSSDLELLLGDGQSHSSVQTAIRSTAQASFVGKVNWRADYIELNGSTFGSDATFERTGPNLNMSIGGWNANGNNTGGNTFNGSVMATNHSGTTWNWGVLSADVFKGNAVFRHGRGSQSELRIAQAGATLFEGNLTLQSTPDALSSGGITVGHAGDTTTLAVGKQLSTTGFLGGYVKLQRFRQLGFTNPQTLNLSELATLQLSQVIFDSQLTATAGHLELANSTFRRASIFTKTGTGSDYSNGNNEFSQRVKFDNQAASGNNLVFILYNNFVKQ
jgi:hypothetical protein